MQNTLGLTILKKIEKSQMRVHKDVGLIVICLYVHWRLKCLGGVIFGWKPGQSSKFRPILDIQEPLTDFHGNEAKKIKMADSKKLSCKIANSQYFL